MPRTKSQNQTKIKNQIIRLRVTAAESEEFKQKAKDAGFKTISEYIRSMCLHQDENIKDSNTKKSYYYNKTQ